MQPLGGAPSIYVNRSSSQSSCIVGDTAREGCGNSRIRFIPVSRQPAARHRFQLPASAINKLSAGETNVLWWHKCLHSQVPTSSHVCYLSFLSPVFLVISMLNRARSFNDKRIFLWQRQRPSSGHIRQQQTDKYKYKCAWRPIILDVKQANLGLWPPSLRHPHRKHSWLACFGVLLFSNIYIYIFIMIYFMILLSVFTIFHSQIQELYFWSGIVTSLSSSRLFHVTVFHQIKASGGNAVKWCYFFTYYLQLAQSSIDSCCSLAYMSSHRVLFMSHVGFWGEEPVESDSTVQCSLANAATS